MAGGPIVTWPNCSFIILVVAGKVVIIWHAICNKIIAATRLLANFVITLHQISVIMWTDSSVQFNIALTIDTNWLAIPRHNASLWSKFIKENGGKQAV